MRILGKPARLLRKVIGARNKVDLAGNHASQQMAELSAQLQTVSGLQLQLSEQMAELAFQMKQAQTTKPDDALPPGSEGMRLLCRFAQVMEGDGQLGLHDLSELEELSRKGLFIVGNARSGTTILFKCLNLSKDLYLMGEANLFMHHGEPDFRAHFNRKHDGMKTPPMKGTTLPEASIPLRGGMGYLAWLARHYRYVGEKLAFGVGLAPDGRPQQDAFYEFQSRFFFLGTYFLAIRTPVECVWSMHKMFPEIDIEALIECWLRSVNLCIDLYSSFPNCHMILLENLTHETITRISELLETEISLPPTMVSEKSKASRLSRGELPEVLSSFRRPLESCDEIYDYLASRISPETLLYNGDGDMIRFLTNPLKKQIARALDSVIPGATCLRYRLAG